MNSSLKEKIFWELYNAKNETEVDKVLQKYPQHFDNPDSWYPLGGNESNFGVVENQQSNPVAALVEKLTNSIDAILMRQCLEAGVYPRSTSAPRSVEKAVERFFPHHKDWDLPKARNQQAENIQLVADSNPRDTANTSLIIYDNGEGQHPNDFEDTFLSLLRGNKNEIHFVQGKYNMGGSGAIVFCGKRRYQLIASKRFDESGEFGFTLIRKHPLSAEEAYTKKNTWYEYFKLNGSIPSFLISNEGIDLRLHNRHFTTGTIIKLYSYDTKGNRHLRRDMSRSLNEFLYEPALPVYIVEKEERYPNDNVLTGVVFGLKRQLDDNDYIETTFSEEFTDKRIGRVKVMLHVFKVKAKDKNSKETKKTIQNEYFKNNMSVLFSVNGQVHGHYTSEFITRTLRFNLLRDYLLIHVDCTDINLDFRNELFMASRDRLKQGDESSYLRKILGDNLRSGQLKDYYKQRKDSISVETADDDSLLRNFAENLPISNELRGLISKTFKLDTHEKQKKKRRPSKQPEKHQVEFNPKRFPSFFKLNAQKDKDGRAVISVPLGGSKTVQFDSDVENQYFDRVEEPGDLQIALMGYTPNDATGGNEKGTVNGISDLLSVNKRSPQDGKIKVVFKPEDDVQVGDEVEIKVNLHSEGHPENEFQQILWVKISEPLSKQPQKVSVTDEDEKIGLPKHVLVFESKGEDGDTKKTWEELDEMGISMDYDTVMFPLLEDDVLETIYINMDSGVLKNYKSQKRRITLEQNQLADRRYITAVYFHTLFLYVINKNKKYEIYREKENSESQSVDLGDYLQELFASHYAAFLLNFGTGELMEGLS